MSRDLSANIYALLPHLSAAAPRLRQPACPSADARRLPDRLPQRQLHDRLTLRPCTLAFLAGDSFDDMTRRAHGTFLPAREIGHLIARHPEAPLSFQQNLRDFLRDDLRTVVAFRFAAAAPVFRPATELVRNVLPGDRDPDFDRHILGFD